MQQVDVSGKIRLDQFLKWAGVASTGGHGKVLVLSGQVRVNGEKVLSRGRVLSHGDVVSVDGAGEYLVAGGETSPGVRRQE